MLLVMLIRSPVFRRAAARFGLLQWDGMSPLGQAHPLRRIVSNCPCWRRWPCCCSPAARSLAFEGFFSLRWPSPADRNASWLAAIGMTFVILSGGIDLSIGSVIALHGPWSRPHWSRTTAVGRGAAGTARARDRRLFGALIGCGSSSAFAWGHFIVALADMFLARGLCYLISIDSISSSPTTATRE